MKFFFSSLRFFLVCLEIDKMLKRTGKNVDGISMILIAIKNNPDRHEANRRRLKRDWMRNSIGSMAENQWNSEYSQRRTTFVSFITISWISNLTMTFFSVVFLAWLSICWRHYHNGHQETKLFASMLRLAITRRDEE